MNIEELLQKEKQLVNKLQKLRVQVVEDKQLSDANEAHLWLTTNFKEKGLTNDKKRNAYITQQMGLLYPSFYESRKAEIANIESEIKLIRETISVMMQFDIKEIDLEPKTKEDKDKGNGA